VPLKPESGKDSNSAIKPNFNHDNICRLSNHRVTAGCTAVVALKIGDILLVANAGDSRGVLCRDGRAYALSEDHKPRSEIESTRIQNAGGFVTMEGRVNGNLNLSRSLGDLKYKQVKGVPKEGQIISAEPDISLTKLQPGDSFFVLACDGVWDIMSNDQIVEFILERLAKGQSLDDIVDAIFKHCVTDNPKNTGGLGGDNMTCVIVLLNKD
jgi:serine/threonine protein phosphatase PrpC